MKRILSLFLMLFSANIVVAQITRVAILDFDNISGIAKYDGLGKAMSSMLISDIEANVSPKRLQLVERAQIQKILKEQNFQASGSVNKNTSVKTGKILGVNYLLVGDVYILNDQLIINVRLTNTETGDIVFSKKQEGKTIGWLTLKTIIAKELATSLSQPFTEPIIPDKEISVATITTYGNAISAKDNGQIGKAENLLETVQEYNPEFKYVDELKAEMEELKKSIQQLQKTSNEINNKQLK
jgi:TolB-like protein